MSTIGRIAAGAQRREQSLNTGGHEAFSRGGIGVRPQSWRRVALERGHPRQRERCEKGRRLAVHSARTELACRQGQEGGSQRSGQAAL